MSVLGVFLISVCSRFERRVVCRSGSEHSGSTEASWFESKAFRWWLVFVSLPGCMKIELVNFKKVFVLMKCGSSDVKCCSL